MYRFFERGKRGGISVISHRKAEANNPYLESNYNPEKKTCYIPYLDANNLYGWAMCFPLPVENFKWISGDDLKELQKNLINRENLHLFETSGDAIAGCMLEVDLEYPNHLHDLHNDFPLAPERKTPPGSKTAKLIPNLFDKNNYVVYYRNFQFYLEKGLILIKIHRGKSFTEKDWMKSYIEKNTN